MELEKQIVNSAKDGVNLLVQGEYVEIENPEKEIKEISNFSSLTVLSIISKVLSEKNLWRIMVLLSATTLLLLLLFLFMKVGNNNLFTILNVSKQAVISICFLMAVIVLSIPLLIYQQKFVLTVKKNKLIIKHFPNFEYEISCAELNYCEINVKGDNPEKIDIQFKDGKYFVDINLGIALYFRDKRYIFMGTEDLQFKIEKNNIIT